MSFQSGFPRTFSVTSIRAYAPDVCGVYGLSNGREWILIDGADNIQTDLLKHAVERRSEGVRALSPTGFVYEACDRSRIEARRIALSKKFAPVYHSVLDSSRSTL